MTTALLTRYETDLYEGVRDFDAPTLLRQIGAMNILAVSGGRWLGFDNGIKLPVAHGYAVEVFLAADDTYTVRTTFTRGAKGLVEDYGPVWTKYEVTGIYAEDIGNAVYTASCYRDL